MKRPICAFLACLLIVTLLPAAFAAGNDVKAIYAAPGSQIITNADGSKDLADTVILMEEDGGFQQYVIHGNQAELYSQGQYVLSGEPGGNTPAIMTVTVQQLHQSGHEMADVALTYDVNLSAKDMFCLYPLKAENGVKVVAAFMQADKQKLEKADGSEELLSTLWLYYDNETFQQYSVLPDYEVALFSTGDYSIRGDFSVADSILTIHRTQKYADDTGLAAYDSTHKYIMGELGFVRLYPADESSSIPAAVPSAPAPLQTPAPTQEPVAPAPAPVASPAPATQERTGELTKEEALAIALNRAGLSRDQIDFVKKIELDYEHGRKVYEVSFYQGGFEYEFEIDVMSGSVLKYEKDWD